MPKFMMIVKASADSEAGVLPTTEQFAEMGKYNEELVKAGVLLAGEGLHPTSRGKRIEFRGNKKTVVDGPFAETKELIAGFWLIQAKSLEEAVEWARRAPNPHFGGDTNIEVRQIFSDEDFGPALTDELREQEQRLRDETRARHGSSGTALG
jgi:hypothetical protein